MAEDHRRRIRELERELTELSRRQEQERRSLESRNRVQLDQLRNEIRRIERTQTEQLRRAREEMAAEMQRQMEELRRSDAASQAQRQRLVRELQEVNRTLEEEIADLRRQEIARNDARRETAERLYRQAEEQARMVQETPHDFFCPGQLKICREHLASVQAMMRAGMFDAASAVADAAQTELEILAVNIWENQREWMQIYEVYRRIAADLRQTLARFEEESVSTVYGTFRLTDEERAYWSGGNYQRVREEVFNAYQMTEGVESAGSVTAYLNQGGGLKGFQLTQRINGLHRLSERLTAAISCIHSERIYSDQRYQMAEEAEKLLAAGGYRTMCSCFRGEPVEEPIDCYDLTVSLNGIDFIRLSFVPQREQGIVVRNLCLLTLDIRTVPDPQLVQARAQDMIHALQDAFPGLTAVWYRDGDRRIAETERQYNRPPDMMQLAKKLERKYQ